MTSARSLHPDDPPPDPLTQHPQLSHLLTGLIPRAQIRTYPDAAHGFLFQYPTEAATEVNEFLAADNENMPSSPFLLTT